MAKSEKNDNTIGTTIYINHHSTDIINVNENYQTAYITTYTVSEKSS